MNLDIINSDLQDYLKTKDLKLFEVTYHKGDKTLSIILDEKLDMDELEKISNELSEYLDQFEDDFKNNYILDVSTVGVERPIRNIEEMKQAINSYIYIKTKENEYTGTLLDFSNNTLKLEYKDKTRVLNVELEYDKVLQARYAVKF